MIARRSRRKSSSSKPQHFARPPSPSPLRWAGGKTHLLSLLLRNTPTKYGRYLEPMLGGGALFFSLRPHGAVLGDINKDLINFFSVLRTHRAELTERLLRLAPSTELYYALRRTPASGSLDEAVRFAYLNRLAWNGLYRVNQNGAFNVPIGDRRPAKMWEADTLDPAASALQSARLIAGDFAKVLRLARTDDFVFLDPPYPRGARYDLGFNRYSSFLFTMSHHKRLAAWVDRLSDRGVHVMLTLADRSELRDLYPVGLTTSAVVRPALISGNGHARRHVRELILTNYRPAPPTASRRDDDAVVSGFPRRDQRGRSPSPRASTS